VDVLLSKSYVFILNMCAIQSMRVQHHIFAAISHSRRWLKK
jgi:hypothetical protein